MLMGHVVGLPEPSSETDILLPDHLSEVVEDDEEAGSSSQILYMASFEELAKNYLLYDTIIWFLISLLLVLAWGIGVLMMLYLPIKRYILQKDISSRKLFVTPAEIVYKVSRPSFIPFWGVATIETRVPLGLVIDIIIEQGWLQSMYGIHTVRIESISHGKAAPVDELQVQGVSNPGLLRKVIITEASKVIQDPSRALRLGSHASPGDFTGRMGSLTDGTAAFRSPSKNWRVPDSPYFPAADHRSTGSGDLLLHKLDEVNRSVKRIELLIEKSHVPSSSC
ncbi:hypothetical protein Droror1_Dr00004919 [Drosera rotundifolia]